MEENRAMTARDTILASIRRSLGVSGREAPRRKAVADRLREHPEGVVPARGKLAPKSRAELFRKMVEAAAGSIEEVPRAADVPGAVAAFLRAHNLPMAVRRGEDPRLAAMPWQRERTLEVKQGASDGNDLAAVSHAFGAVAESGTLMLTSGKDNPTTLNFLPTPISSWSTPTTLPAITRRCGGNCASASAPAPCRAPSIGSPGRRVPPTSSRP